MKILVKLNTLGNRLLLLLYMINFIMFLNDSTYCFIAKYLHIINLIGLVMILCLISGRKRRLQLPKNAMSIFLFFLGYLGIGFFIKGTLKGSFAFVYSLLCYFVVSSVKLDEKLLKVLYLVLLSLFFIWLLKINHYYDYFMTQLYIQKNENVLNSNTVGAIMLIFTILLCAITQRLSGKKIIQVIFCVLGLWGVWNTGSRGAFIALLFFTIANFAVPKKFLKKKSIMIGGYAVICFMGVVFPMIYVRLGMKAKGSVVLLNGKNVFSGREQIWNEFFLIANQNILKLLFGIGEWKAKGLLYLNADGNNLHNWFLKIIFSFGIIGLICYHGLIIYNLKCIYSKAVNDVQVILLIGFMAILINDFVENLIGFYTLTSLVYLILGLGNNSVMQNDKNIIGTSP